MKIKRLIEGVGWVFFCPAYEQTHSFYTTGSVTWSFNGNQEKPTFTPSLKNSRPGYCCHLNLTDGKLFYHADCTHSVRGEVDLPDWSYESYGGVE